MCKFFFSSWIDCCCCHGWEYFSFTYFFVLSFVAGTFDYCLLWVFFGMVQCNLDTLFNGNWNKFITFKLEWKCQTLCCCSRFVQNFVKNEERGQTTNGTQITNRQTNLTNRFNGYVHTVYSVSNVELRGVAGCLFVRSFVRSISFLLLSSYLYFILQ